MTRDSRETFKGVLASTSKNFPLVAMNPNMNPKWTHNDRTTHLLTISKVIHVIIEHKHFQWLAFHIFNVMNSVGMMNFFVSSPILIFSLEPLVYIELV